MADAQGRGITVTEMTAMDEPVDASAHTVAAFVGRALRGPLDTPVLLRSFHDFSRRFGDVWSRSSLGPAVRQFFEHGGKMLYVVRVANAAHGALLRVPTPDGSLEFEALEPGSTERIRASVDYDRLQHDDTEHFNLILQRVSPGTSLVVDQEIYTRISCRPESRRYVVDVVADSDIVRLTGTIPLERPFATIGPHIDFDTGYLTPEVRGDDGNELTDYDLIGSAIEHRGMFALDAIDVFDLLYLPPPGRRRDVGPAATLAAELYCRKRGAMLISDPPSAWQTERDALSGVRERAINSPNVLTYFPRMLATDDPTGRPRAVGGAVAGLLCRNDERYGPWSAIDDTPARFSNALRPALELTDATARDLVRQGVNAIIGRRPGSARLQGSVTLARGSQIDGHFRRLEERRLCLHITNAIGRATRWAVFEPGGTRVAMQVRAQVHAYMTDLASRGAFRDERFDVQCEAGLHLDPLDPERGVTILLSFLPAGAERHLWLTLHQTVRGFKVAPTAFAPIGERCA